MHRSPDQLPLPFPTLPERSALPLCREVWRYCSCDACQARRLYYHLFGIPPFSCLAPQKYTRQETPPMQHPQRCVGREKRALINAVHPTKYNTSIAR